MGGTEAAFSARVGRQKGFGAQIFGPAASAGTAAAAAAGFTLAFLPVHLPRGEIRKESRG